MLFQKGNKVSAFGCEGVVDSISSNGLFVIVRFPESRDLVVFNADGKLFKWSKKVDLKNLEEASEGNSEGKSCRLLVWNGLRNVVDRLTLRKRHGK